MTNKAKTKSTYSVNYYSTSEDYDNNNATVLGYVTSVSMRGAEMQAKRTISYPSGGWVVLENLTQKAERESRERLRQEAQENKRKASGLSEEQLQTLEEEFRAITTSENNHVQTQVQLSHFDRAINDAHQRISWDMLEETNPVLFGLYTRFIEETEMNRAPVVSKLREQLTELHNKAQELYNVGILEEDNANYYMYQLTRFENNEEGRG